MAFPTSKVTSRIPGGPPAQYQEWSRYGSSSSSASLGVLPSSSVKAVGKRPSRPSMENHIKLPSIYGGGVLPVFGPQYGSGIQFKDSIPADHQKFNALYPENRERDGLYSFVELSESLGKVLREISVSKEADNEAGPSTDSRANLQFPSWSTTPSASSSRPNSIVEIQPLAPVHQEHDLSVSDSCIVCLEDFTSTRIPPSLISDNCGHTPSVCTECLQTSIRADIDTKIWNQVKCPECGIVLIFDDIRRLADPHTFARYETLSFRSAVGADENFVWCQKCKFGQLHASGDEEPIVRCMNCQFRSCFKHSVPWHERLTCDEYDEMLRDPDGFKSAIEREEEAYAESKQQKEREALWARKRLDREKHAEEQRQRQRHEEQLLKARAEQEAQARMMKEQEKAQEKAAIRRRQAEEQMSFQTVQAQTKPCPGCRRPIEKNGGCDHMKCIKCGFEFCWECLNEYHNILRTDNSGHKNSCKFHTKNLRDC